MMNWTSVTRALLLLCIINTELLVVHGTVAETWPLEHSLQGGGALTGSSDHDNTNNNVELQLTHENLSEGETDENLDRVEPDENPDRAEPDENQEETHEETGQGDIDQRANHVDGDSANQEPREEKRLWPYTKEKPHGRSFLSVLFGGRPRPKEKKPAAKDVSLVDEGQNENNLTQDNLLDQFFTFINSLIERLRNLFEGQVKVKPKYKHLFK